MSIGQRVRQAREAKKMSQLRLRALTGIAQSTLSELETGKNEQTTYVASLAAALGVSAIWLAEGKGPMVPGQQKDAAVLDDVVVLIGLFRDSNAAGRALILDAAKFADKG